MITYLIPLRFTRKSQGKGVLEAVIKGLSFVQMCFHIDIKLVKYLKLSLKP